MPSNNHEKDETLGASAATPSLSAPRIGRDIPLVATFSPGDVLAGRFRIVRFIAAGGMGEVYEAEDSELGGRVALKTIRSGIAEEAGSIDRFKREVHLARQVTHANVCRIYDVFRHEGTTFLTHRVGVIHRDFKSANVMLVPDAGEESGSGTTPDSPHGLLQRPPRLHRPRERRRSDRSPAWRRARPPCRSPRGRDESSASARS